MATNVAPSATTPPLPLISLAGGPDLLWPFFLARCSRASVRVLFGVPSGVGRPDLGEHGAPLVHLIRGHHRHKIAEGEIRGAPVVLSLAEELDQFVLGHRGLPSSKNSGAHGTQGAGMIGRDVGSACGGVYATPPSVNPLQPHSE